MIKNFENPKFNKLINKGKKGLSIIGELHRKLFPNILKQLINHY